MSGQAGRSGEGCFEENIALFADSRTEPEKFNLYTGLMLLARAATRQEAQLNRVEQKLDLLLNQRS